MKTGRPSDLLDDEVNQRIIRCYMEDSRRSFREVARRVGLAPGTVVARMKQMEDAGLIEQYTVKMNTDAMGYTLTAIIRVIMKEGAMMDRKHEIASFREICGLYNTTGNNDAVIIAKFQHREEINAFTKKLVKHPDVKKTSTSIVLTTLKEDFNLL